MPLQQESPTAGVELTAPVPFDHPYWRGLRGDIVFGPIIWVTAMGAPLVRPLFPGPVDIIGDVHGEFDALRDLLRCMGYREDGIHPEGRRLVFAGDLTDRGPDNIAVVNFVRTLVEADPPRAQVTLGNHDLNLALSHKRAHNEWFFAESPDRQQQVREFLRSLPIVLERPDLRVVHACWNREMVDLARSADDVIGFYKLHAERIRHQNDREPQLDEIARRLNLQNRNPVKLLTSGPERRASAPFETGGKVRQEERVEWWTDYTDPVWCVFGHYAIPTDQKHFFGKAVCIDFGGGYRALERSAPGFTGTYTTRLGAARFPRHGGSAELPRPYAQRIVG